MTSIANGQAVWIKDFTFAGEGPLFPVGGGGPDKDDGDKVYLRAEEVTITFRNMWGHSPIIFADEASKVYDQRKGHHSFVGFRNPTILIKGELDLRESVTGTLGGVSGTAKVATVGRLWKLWQTPRVFYFQDGKIVKTLYADTINGPTNSIVGTEGMPIVIVSLVFRATGTDQNILGYELGLTEAREVEI